MLGQMRHFQHHRPSRAHVVKYDYCSGDLTFPVVDRSGGVFDCAFISVPSNQDTVRGQPYSLILLNCQFEGIGCRLMRSPVNNLEHVTERMTECLFPDRKSVV